MTVIQPLPPTTLPPGSGNISPQVDIPVGSDQMIVRLLKIGWPGDGQKVGDFRLLYSAGGNSWVEITKGDVYDVPEDANPMPFAGDIPDTLNGKRRLRVEWTLLRSVQVSGSIEANTKPKKAV